MSPVTTVGPNDPIYDRISTKSPLLSAIPYPSPFFDIAQTYMPSTYRELFDFCTYFYNTHCLVPAVINKLASYPITDLIYATKDDGLKKKWEGLCRDQLSLPFEMFQFNIDTFVRGNCFIGIYIPFKRFLRCTQCDSVYNFSSVKDKKVKSKKLTITGTCPECKGTTLMEIEDKPSKNIKGLNIIRYDAKNITIIRDPVSGHNKYLWDLPQTYIETIRKGEDMDAFERAPRVVLDAVRNDHLVVLNPDLMYHMKRPSLSDGDSAWGPPLIMPALKSLYYLQVLKMAQEAIASQHIVPLRVLFPQGGNGAASSPPAALLNLGKWKSTIEDELAKWRRDKNYIPILNSPIGIETIGGDGRAMLLSQEIKQEHENIIVSMNVPLEFVWGGLTWTGSSITLRMLENTFTGIRDGLQGFLRFFVRAVSKHMGYGAIDIYMTDLKMSDDVQRQQILMNLNAAGKLSDTTMLNELGYDLKEEEDLKKAEFPIKMIGFIRDTLLQAKAQGEASILSTQYQIKAQMMQMQAFPEQAGAVPPEEGGASAEGSAPAEEVDPTTGLPIDAQTGLPYDAATGTYYDPQSGQPIPPEVMDQYMQEMSGQATAAPEQAQPAPQIQELPAQVPTSMAPNLIQDTETGLLYDTMSGQFIHPQTMQPMSEDEKLQFFIQRAASNPQPVEVLQDKLMKLLSQQEYINNAYTQMVPKISSITKTAAAPGEDASGKPIAAPPGAGDASGSTGAITSNQKEDAYQEQEMLARKGLMGQMPPRVKSLVTSWAKELSMLPSSEREAILAEMRTSTPTIAQLVVQRMSELSTIKPAIPTPKQPVVQPPIAGMKPTTVQRK